jgi:cytidine deaminase
MLSTQQEAEYRKLIAAAKAVSELAYRPYSKFNVGAAILTFDGQTFTGCNVENCAYTPTIHAEQTALVKAISEGALKRALDAGLSQLQFIKAVAVYAPKGSDPWPCCICRQTLSEFGLDMDVIGYAGTDESQVLVMKLGELIPHAFPMEEVLASVHGGK